MIRTIYFKELKDALRDSKTLLLSVLLPVAMIVGMIFFMESMFKDDPGKVYVIAVADTAEQEVLDWLGGMDAIEPRMSGDPLQAVEQGEDNAALIVSGGFASKLQAGQTVELDVHSDLTSKKSSEAVSALKRGIELYQADVVAQRLTEMGVALEQITPFQTTVHSLHAGNDASLALVSMLLSIVIIFSVMLGGFPIATDLFAGEKERKTMEALLITPVSRSKLITAKWLAISTLGAAGGVFALIAFVATTSLFTEKMAEALTLGTQPVMTIASALVCVVLFSMLFAALQAMISIYAKSFKEAQNYMTPVMFIGIAPYFMLMGVSPNELDAAHFITPFMNIHAFLKELIYGIFSVQSLVLTIGSTLAYMIICFAAAVWMFRKDKWVLGR